MINTVYGILVIVNDNKYNTIIIKITTVTEVIIIVIGFRSTMQSRCFFKKKI